MEILAPAGGMEQLIAAIRCGADAVYLGAKAFNARGNAENFENLKEAVSYCHARSVKVYVAVNTLVADDELPALRRVLRDVQESCADAVIIQDLAACRLVRECCPGLSMHASTQMTIHNKAGAQALERLGFSQVVLARELTIDEIRAIHEATSLQLEVFIHGALCMSMSGACYLSSMLGGRSGNRGVCAQPCRLDFTAGNRGHALSLKDLSAIDHLSALREAGVSAVKIEGRMKGPEYVAAAVIAVREAMSGRPYDAQELAAVFSRGGFTDGYLTGKRDLSMFGVRSDADTEASRRAQSAFRSRYQRERPAVPIHMALSLSAKGTQLTASDGALCVTIQGEAPQAANDMPTDYARAFRSLSKSGDTPFYLSDLTLSSDPSEDPPNGWMLPASSLNALRREALEKLLKARQAPMERLFFEQPLPHFAPHKARETPALYARFQSASQLPESVKTDRVVLPLFEISGETVGRFGDKLVAELPAALFPGEETAAREKLLSLKADGLSMALCEQLGAVRIARETGLSVIGGAMLNILNSLSLAEYAALGVSEATVSFELHHQRITALAEGIPRGAVAYGYLPLMRLRCCPAQGPHGCGACDGHPALTDRKGISFPLVCHQRRFQTLLNSIPLNLAGTPLPGIDFQMLYFTIESPETCGRIIEDFITKKAPDTDRTRGLYYRKLI